MAGTGIYRPGVDVDRRSPNRASHRTPAQWWRDLRLVAKGLVVLAIPVAALIGAVVASLYFSHEQAGYQAVLNRSSVTGAQIDQTLLLLLDAETGVRGYAATSDPTFLQPYDQAVGQLPGQLRTLQRQLSSDPASRRDITSLVSLTDVALAHLASVRQGVADGVTSRAVLTRELSQGKGVVDEFRRLVNDLQAHQRTVLAGQQASVAAAADASDVVDWVELAVGILGGGVAMLLLLVGVVRRVNLVKDNAARFVNGKPLLPMPGARDEIGQLSGVLGRATVLLADRDAELRAAHDEAVAASRAKDEFLSRMSHELRTPLTSILGFSQLLQMEELGTENAESVDQIVRAGHHLLTLINEVLDIARIESGNLSLSLEPVVVEDLVAESVALMAPMAAAREVVVDVRAAPGLVVLADLQRLKQVLLNLLSNAVKYNRQGGRITVSCEAEGETAALAVADTGLGIPAAKMDRLFVPFDRLDADRSDVEGTGVGLSLCQALMEAMHGEIEVESEPGAGSTFTLRLPLHRGTASGEGRSTAAVADGSGDVVLYVEDNLASLRVVERIFEGRPETLQVAVQGRLCLQLAHELHPRLILLDLHLPDMDGEEVFEQLRADPATADIPVVLISADASAGRAERLLERGAAAFLGKPMDIRRFISLLDETAPAATRP